MPKRRRLLMPMKKKVTVKSIYPLNPEKEEKIEIPTTPRGRLKGALKDVLDPIAGDSDDSVEQKVSKRNIKVKCKSESSSDDEDESYAQTPRAPYVLKLFDRSVDLSQFEEDSPLYPICRAWIANQPRMCYKKFGKKKYLPPKATDESVELPGPEGPRISRIPPQIERMENKDNSSLNAYLNNRSAPGPSRASLLAEHCARWGGVRRAWALHAARVELRYRATQQLLNKINVINSSSM